tara:strand:- start:422 stop:1258 length:837 start_codon:yes stop_codon:yes gene_type:complete
MPIINKGITFSNGEQLTAEKINDLVDLAAFNQSATDTATITLNTTGQLIVAEGGIGTSKIATGAVEAAEIATDAVETIKIKDSSSKTDGVTLPKIQRIDTAKVLGRTSADEGNVEEVGVVIGESGDAGLLFDNDDLLDNSDTAGGSATRGATQRSVKAYVDASPSSSLQSSTAAAATGTISGTSSYTELDLSSVVGSNKAMVIMEVYNGSANRGFHFRTNGSPGQYTSQGGSSSVFVGPSNVGGTVVVTTDSAGKLQHRANSTSTGTTYVVQAFQVIV